MEPWVQNLVDSMICRIGQTVTIFTTSGGLSGAGFTGVLVSVDCNVVRLLTDQGAPPACSVGSACCCESFGSCGGKSGGGFGGFGGGYGGGFGDGCGCEDANFCGNPFGSICVIPTCSIAAFVHHSI